MKFVAAVLIWMFVPAPVFAQIRSLWLEDLTMNEAQTAVAAGRTTAIYYAAGVHQSGPAVALGKHMFLARYLAQRLAEQLGDALVLPINPYAPSGPGGDPGKREGHMRFAGTLSITDETFGKMVRETVTSAIVSAGFKTVLILGDHGYGQDTNGRFDGGQLKSSAERLDSDWKAKGTRVHYIPLYLEADQGFMKQYLEKRGVEATRRTPIDDVSEMLFIDREGKWIRQDKIPLEDRPIASADLGKLFTDNKISTAVRLIRSVRASGQ